MSKMDFTLQTKKGSEPFHLEYQRVFAIGYAGRNMEKTMEHIRELEEQLGVPAPKKIPTIFQCGNYTLTQEHDLHFVGEKTCGEVEYIIIIKDGKRYMGWAAIIRAINTVDAVTAQSVEIPFDMLCRMRDRIIAEVPGVNRVLWDISDKPVSTIEWE